MNKYHANCKKVNVTERKCSASLPIRYATTNLVDQETNYGDIWPGANTWRRALFRL